MVYINFHNHSLVYSYLFLYAVFTPPFPTHTLSSLSFYDDSVYLPLYIKDIIFSIIYYKKYFFFFIVRFQDNYKITILWRTFHFPRTQKKPITNPFAMSH